MDFGDEDVGGGDQKYEFYSKATNVIMNFWG